MRPRPKAGTAFARALRYGWDGALHINSADNVYRIQGNTPTALIPLATVSGTLTVNASAASSVQREDYTYDPADRLASVMRDGHPAEQFGYDPVGSRAIDRQAQDYVYDAMNRLTQGNGASYTYDANGNRLSKTDANGVTRYTWDGENRLVRIDFPDGRKADYAYDPLHRRIAKTLTDAQGAQTLRRYVYDGLHLLLELDGQNNVLGEYLHGSSIDEVIACGATVTLTPTTAMPWARLRR